MNEIRICFDWNVLAGYIQLTRRRYDEKILLLRCEFKSRKITLVFYPILKNDLSVSDKWKKPKS